MRRHNKRSDAHFFYLMGYFSAKNPNLTFKEVWNDYCNPYSETHYQSLILKRRKVVTLHKRHWIILWEIWHETLRRIFNIEYRKHRIKIWKMKKEGGDTENG